MIYAAKSSQCLDLKALGNLVAFAGICTKVCSKQYELPEST